MEKTTLDLQLDVLKGLEGTNFSTANLVGKNNCNKVNNVSFSLHVPSKPDGKWGKKGYPEQYINVYPVDVFTGIDDIVGDYATIKKFFEKELISDKICLELLKSNKYSFLPKVLHSTNKYVYVEKFNEYTTPAGEDFLHTTTAARFLLGASNSSVKFSAFGQDVLNKLNTLYKEQIIDKVTTSDMIKNKAYIKPTICDATGREFKKFDTPENVGVCFDQIRVEDFAVKKDGDKIIDWKYIGIDNISIGPALNYFILDEYNGLSQKAQHAVRNSLEDCDSVEIEKDITYCVYNKSWYKVA